MWGDEPGYRISGAVYYDATDISLAADLKDESHMFVVAAMNKDVKTFDSMVSALRYHMHVLIVNSGEFGGSTVQAPYDQEHKRLVSHVHGSNQIAASIFDVCVDDFGQNLAAADASKTVMKSVNELAKSRLLVFQDGSQKSGGPKTLVGSGGDQLGWAASHTREKVSIFLYDFA